MRHLVLLVLLLPIVAAAQAPDARLAELRRTLDAGVALAAPDSLLSARAGLSVLAAGDDDAAAWAGYYAALADYRLAYAFWGADAERAGRHAAQGAATLDALRRGRLPDGLPAEAAALHAAVLNARLGLDRSLAASLGPAATAATAEAVRLAPDNPRVLFVQATSLFNTPPEWGGDPERALATFQRSIGAFEAETPAGPAPRWGHDEALAWLGMAHLTRDELAEARAAIDAAEAMQPRSPFVTQKLRPWLESLEAAE